MEHREPTNPHLADVFKTAIEVGKKGPSREQPSIVVNGSHNVISWGGNVYMAETDPLDHQGAARVSPA